MVENAACLLLRLQIEDALHRCPPIAPARGRCAPLKPSHERFPFLHARMRRVRLVVARGVESLRGVVVHEEPAAAPVDPHVAKPKCTQSRRDLRPDALVKSAVLGDARGVVDKIKGHGE